MVTDNAAWGALCSKLLILWLTFSGIASAQSQNVKPPAASKTVNPNAVGPPDTRSLLKKIESLEKKVADLESAMEANADLIGQYGSEIYRLKHAEAELDPASPDKYQRIETAVGPLLVSLGKAEPYLDGYKVQLQIGNPLAAQFSGFTVSTFYAPRQRKDEKFLEWIRKRKGKDFVFTQTLISSRWNIVELIFPDVTPDAFGYLKVSISVNQVILPN
jgi:hypothetical protein